MVSSLAVANIAGADDQGWIRSILGEPKAVVITLVGEHVVEKPSSASNADSCGAAKRLYISRP
jgi:hypothetical protein